MAIGSVEFGSIDRPLLILKPLNPDFSPLVLMAGEGGRVWALGGALGGGLCDVLILRGFYG